MDTLTLHQKIADSYASQRKPKADWVGLTDLQPQIEEVHHRILANQTDEALKLFTEIAPYLLKWGDNKSVIELGEHLRKEVTHTNPLLLSLLHNIGLAYINTGEFRLARERLEAALNIAPPDNKSQLGAILGNLGCVYHDLREYAEARSCHERALEISRLTKDRRAEGDDLGNLGSVYAALGDYQNAIKCQTQALEIAREIKNRTGEANCLTNLGDAHRLNGDVELGITLMEESLPIRREIRDKQGEATASVNLAIAYEKAGNIEKSIEHYENAIKQFGEIGNQRFVADIQGELGYKHLALGNNQAAMNQLKAALESFRQNRDRHKEAMTLLFLGLASFNLDQYEECQEFCEAASRIFEELGDMKGKGKALGTMGGADIRLHDQRNAYIHWTQAVKLLESVSPSDADVFRQNLALHFPSGG